MYFDLAKSSKTYFFVSVLFICYASHLHEGKELLGSASLDIFSVAFLVKFSVSLKMNKMKMFQS